MYAVKLFQSAVTLVCIGLVMHVMVDLCYTNVKKTSFQKISKLLFIE